MSKTTTFEPSIDGEEFRITGLVAAVMSPHEIVRSSAMRIEPPYNKKERLLISQIRTSKVLSAASKRNLLPLVEVHVPTEASSGKQQKPLSQLNDARLGSSDFSEICRTCKLNNADCPGHLSFVQMPIPICAVPYVPFVRRVLASVCYFCSEFVTRGIEEKLPPVDVAHLASLSQVKLDRWKQARQSAYQAATSHLVSASSTNSLSHPAIICVHCGLPQPVYSVAGCNINAKWPAPSADASYSDVDWQPSEGAMTRFTSVLHKSFVARNGIKDFAARYARLAAAAASSSSVSSGDERDACVMAQLFEEHGHGDASSLPCNFAEPFFESLLQIPIGHETPEERWALRAMTLISHPMRQVLFQSTFTMADAHHVLRGVRGETCWRMGYNPLTGHPKFLTFTHLPVAAKSARPATTESTGSAMKSENSLTTQYKDVLKHVTLLRAKISLLTVECAIATSKRQDLRGRRSIITGRLIGEEDGHDDGDEDESERDASAFHFVNATDRRIAAMPMWMRCQDARSMFQFSLDSDAAQHLSNLALKISAMIDSKASAKKSTGHNSGKNGAKNSANSQHDTRLMLESMRQASSDAAALAEEDEAAAMSRKPPPKSKQPQRPPAQRANHKNSALATISNNADRTHRHWCLCAEIFASLRATQTTSAACTADADPSMNTDDPEGTAESDPSHTLASSLHLFGQALKVGCLFTPHHQLQALPPPHVQTTEKRGVANPSPHIPAYGKQTAAKPLDKIANGKYGRFRGNLLSKRGNWTDRKVLDSCAYIPVDAVGLAFAACKIQTIPHRVTRANVDELKECVRIGSGALGGASKIVTSENKTIYIPKRTRPLDTEPYLAIGWTVHAHIQHGDTVILNRQPSLHRGNHNSRKVMQKPGKTDQVNENSLTRFNGDCDGDEVNMSYSQSIAARTDEIELMSMPYNLTNPRTADLFGALHENSKLGASLFSDVNTFLTREQASAIVGAIRMITKKRRDATKYHGFVDDERFRYRQDITSDAFVPLANDLPQMKADAPPPGWSLPEPCILKPVPLWTGKQIMAMILPKDLVFLHSTGGLDFKHTTDHGSEAENDAMFERALRDDKQRRLVQIVGDCWISGDGGKEIFGQSQSSIIKHIWQHYGHQYACDLISDWCVVVHEYLKIRGFSVGAADFMLGGIPSPEKMAEWMATEREKSDAGETPAAQSGVPPKRPPSAEIEFHKYALEKKAKLVEAVHAAYDEVRTFMASPEVLRHLTRSDVEAARRRIEKFITEVVPRYVTSMTLTYTDTKRNGASIMAATGTKGTIGHQTQMETSLGGISMGGTMIGANMSHPRSRNFAHEHPGEFSASSSGFIASSLSSGLTEVEMMQHTMPARYGIFISSNPRASGYQQRRISALAENQTVRYDGTVRDGSQIIQVLFGGDGVESVQIQCVFLGRDILNAKPLKPTTLRLQGGGGGSGGRLMHGAARERQLSPLLQHHLHIVASTASHAIARTGDTKRSSCSERLVLRDRLVRCVADAMAAIDDGRCTDEECATCRDEHDTIRRLADNLVAATACRPYNKMASARAIKEKHGVEAYLPINMREVMATHAARWTREMRHAHRARAEEFLDNFLDAHAGGEWNADLLCGSLSDYAAGRDTHNLLCASSRHPSTRPVSSHAEFYAHVQELCAAICKRFGPSAMPIDLLLSIRHALQFNGTVHAIYAASRWHLKCLLQDIYDICSQSTVDPGETVGMVMCQSISEPTTQLIMRLFKPEFADVSHTQGGITRQDEILNNTKTSVPSIYCALSPDWVSSMEDAKLVRDQLVGRKLCHWMDANFAVWMNMTPPSPREGAAATAGHAPVTNEMEMTARHLLYPSLWAAIQHSYVSPTDVGDLTMDADDGAHRENYGEGDDDNTHASGNATARRKRKRRTDASDADVHANETTTRGTLPVKKPKAGARRTSGAPDRQGLVLFKFHDDLIRDGAFDLVEADNASSRRWRNRRTLSRLLARILLPWQRGCIVGGPTVHPLCPYYWAVWPMHGLEDRSTWLSASLASPTNAASSSNDTWDAYMIGLSELSKTMRSDLVVTGVEGIQDCISISAPSTAIRSSDGCSSVETPDMCYVLHLRGVDFESVLAHPATFDQYCYTSDLRMIDQIFDLEARSQHTVHELSQVYDASDGNNKIFILPRHFQLLADTTTAAAEVTAVNRYGLEKKSSFASVLCFERTSSKIVESCVAGRFDPMEDIPPNSMFGARAESVGTSIVEVIPPAQTRAKRVLKGANRLRARGIIGNENDDDLLALVAHVCKVRVH